MRRIVLCGWLTIGLYMAATAQDAAPGRDTAVSVVAVVRGDSVISLDVSFPAATSMSVIQSDMQQIARWTGWSVVGRPAETAGNTVSVHAEVTGGGPVQSVLNEVVWPLVAALVQHDQLGMVVMGAQVAAAPLTIENDYVRLEQRGGQGVQSYVAAIKDRNFPSLEELKRPRMAGSPGAGHRRPARMALAWVLALVASGAIGAFTYFLVHYTARRKR